jgi:hypothetical protein
MGGDNPILLHTFWPMAPFSLHRGAAAVAAAPQYLLVRGRVTLLLVTWERPNKTAYQEGKRVREAAKVS